MGGEGEGSGVKGGGKWGLGTPLSTPSSNTDKHTFSPENCKYFLTPQFRHMFWVLKRTIALTRFF